MLEMQVWPRHHHHKAQSPPGQSWPVRLLWLATLIFVLQVGVHAAMPDGMNMQDMVSGLFGVSSQAHGAAEMPEMSVRRQAPGTPAQSVKHATEGLCCMTPVALIPLPWAPPLPLLIRETQTSPKALREVLLLLRATARGPPLN